MTVPLLIATTAIQAISSISAGNAQAASYKASAQAQEYNAEMNRRNADRVSQEYSIREDNLRKQQTQALGRERAAFAQSDTGLGTGSNLDVMNEDTQNAELDALTLRYQGQTERAGLLSQSNLDSYDAQVSRMNASSARQAGYMGAFGKVLGGAGRYYDYSQSTAALKTPSLPWQAPGNVRPSYMGGGTY